MIVDWGYITIVAVYASAMVAYSFNDGSDPWTAAFLISSMILFGKAWAWLFGGSA